MSGFGAMDHMKKSYEQNRKLLKRKNLYQIFKEQHFRTRVKKTKLKRGSTESLADLRKELKARNRRDAIMRLLLLVLTATAIMIPFIYFMFYY